MSAHAKTLRLILGVTLYALPGWAGDSSYITGKIQQFHQQSENCSDQGQPEDCITARNVRNLMPLIAGYVTPMAYGCVGDGVADDTRCLQNAIDAAQMAGLPLRFDTAHLFNITHTLTISAPIYIEGQYRYGIWVVNQSTGKGPEACPWGLVTRNTDIDMIRASAVTGTIRGLCIDMTGNQSINPTAGAAINLTPPDSLHYSSGWHIEQNTILQPFDGIAAYGTGPGKLCCGVGTTADGDAILRNTIVSPAGSAISIGKDHVNNAAGPGTVGITVSDNDIVCKTKISKSQGIGVALYEGAIWYDGTQNGPEGCHIGTLVAPGVISGQQQAAQFDGDGVLGDQSGLYDFLVRPEGGLIWSLNVSGKQPWANATSDKTAVLVDCTVSGSSCQEFTFNSATLKAGPNLAHPIFDIEGGAGGPYDVTIANSMICPNPGGSSNRGGTGIKLNAGAGPTGRWIITGNRIGTGCPGLELGTGISLTIDAGSTAHGSVTITDNDISVATRPIAYSPAAADNIIIANNMGVDTTVPNTITAASSIALADAYPIYKIAGTRTINTISLGAWQGRRITLLSIAGGINLGNSGNICSAVSKAPRVDLLWPPGGTCWVPK